MSRGFAVKMALLDMSYSKRSSGPCGGKDKQPVKVVASHLWYLQNRPLWLRLLCLCIVFCFVHVFAFLFACLLYGIVSLVGLYWSM